MTETTAADSALKAAGNTGVQSMLVRYGATSLTEPTTLPGSKNLENISCSSGRDALAKACCYPCWPTIMMWPGRINLKICSAGLQSAAGLRR